MALATTPETGTSNASSIPGRAAWTCNRFLKAAVVTASLGVGFVVGHDGSLPWQIVRVAVVAILGWSVYVIIDRGTLRQRAGVAFAAGCVTLALGVGIGIPHVIKSGAGPVGIAGLAVLAGGLVLVGHGAAELVRATPRWWRALVTPALVAAIVVALWTLGQAVAATNVPRTSVGSTTPADLGLTYRDVSFETADGVALSGWYIPSTNRAGIVLMHGAGSTRSGVLEQADVLADHGFGVLLFDARGHGRSGGRAMDFGWYGDEDTSAAVSFLRARSDVDSERIAVVGLSMGGEQAIGAAAAADPLIRAVVAEGATNRVASDKAWLSEEFGWRGAMQERIDWLTFGIADLLTAADQPTTLRAAVAAAAPRPVLLIAGGDVENEPLAGRYIQGGSPDTVELWVAPETGHTAALDTHPTEWERRVIAFLSATLLTDRTETSP